MLKNAVFARLTRHIGHAQSRGGGMQKLIQPLSSQLLLLAWQCFSRTSFTRAIWIRLAWAMLCLQPAGTAPDGS